MARKIIAPTRTPWTQPLVKRTCSVCDAAFETTVSYEDRCAPHRMQPVLTAAEQARANDAFDRARDDAARQDAADRSDNHHR